MMKLMAKCLSMEIVCTVGVSAVAVYAHGHLAFAAALSIILTKSCPKARLAYIRNLEDMLVLLSQDFTI